MRGRNRRLTRVTRIARAIGVGDRGGDRCERVCGRRERRERCARTQGDDEEESRGANREGVARARRGERRAFAKTIRRREGRDDDRESRRDERGGAQLHGRAVLR